MTSLLFLSFFKNAPYFCRKQLMRWTVISSDALIFFPAVLYFIIVHYSQPSRSRKTDLAWHITMLLLNPCLILIDHGHFQVWFFWLFTCFWVTRLVVPWFFIVAFCCISVQLYQLGLYCCSCCCYPLWERSCGLCFLLSSSKS